MAKKKNQKSSTRGAVTPSRPTASAPMKRSAAKTEEHDCDYGNVNHEFSHRNEGRIAQLDGYLKAGLIDRKEYQQMLERYRRQEQYFDSEGYNHY